jgi:hypothetical protein
MVMMLDKYIQPGIRRALIIFTATVVCMSTIIVASDLYKAGGEDGFIKTKMEMRKWKSRIDAANRNNQILVDHEDDYYSLKNRAVIGDENRLSWVEVIQRIANERGLASVKYNIASQELDKHENLKTDFAGIDVYHSVMSLDMKLMHEGDFFAVLDALKRDAKGLFVVDRCDMELLNPGAPPSLVSDNIRANCDLSWYTIKKSG